MCLTEDASTFLLRKADSETSSFYSQGSASEQLLSVSRQDGQADLCLLARGNADEANDAVVKGTGRACHEQPARIEPVAR